MLRNEMADTASRKHFAFGVFCTLLGGALWGFSGACLQRLLGSYDISPLFVTVVRMVGSGIVFLIILLITKRDEMKRIFKDARMVGRFIFFGVVGLFFCQITYIMTIMYTNAGTATVLQCTGTIFIMLFSCILARRLPFLRDFIGLILAVTATVLIATQGDLSTLSVPLEGLIWGLLCGLTVMTYVMYPKKLFAQWGSLPVTGLGMLFGGIAAALLYCAGPLYGQPLALPDLDAEGIILFALVVVVGTIAAFALYLHGVSIVGSVKGGLLGTIEPVSATVICAVWLGTVFTGYDIAGLIMMIVMIVLVSGKESEKNQDQSA
ncbi:MAG: EamA family transporter [Eggerthellaceae bacterium]|nr:EamA family transporter [Eggerthellaceae bacterium]